MLFIRDFPALLSSKNGMPVNYRVFKAGIITIGKMNAIDQMKMSRSMRAGQANSDDFGKWIEEKIGQAGMPIVSPEELG